MKCYLREPGSEEILAWLAGQTGLSCCLLGRLEFFAAVKGHVREKRLARRDAERTFRRLESDEAVGLWNWIPISGALVRDACQKMRRLPDSVYLRSADALHLVCAAANGFATIYSHDRHLLAAAPCFDIDGTDLLA
ncbi:MAG: type II toxin-antitoxin system VapC family toxin [Kiritimatiellae bacterium]|nr:type II toxin-antitoxin system VapC family toxin [Kiritimatiellia bacterium]